MIGGDAAGMAVASNARRRRPAADLEIVALGKGRWTSYSACGIPNVLGGDVDCMETLVMRSPEEFRDGYDIDARTQSEVSAVDLDAGMAALAAETTVDELLNLDLSYAPPFGPVWHPVLIAARQVWAGIGRA